jgi:GSCFA family
MRFGFRTGTRPQKANETWYRGEHCNFNPTRMNMKAMNAVEEYILKGWLPSEPFITPETKVTAFGSCFAENITQYLNRRNYTILTASDAQAHVVKMGEGIVNTYALRGQFDWAFRGLSPTTELWHGYNAESYGYDEETRLSTRAVFDATEVFIITLGLSEVWYDEPTGEVFWRAVPASLFDPERHKFRVASVAENVANLRAIYDMIREFRPQARIVVTLSPIPLVATFRPVSSLTANSVSKAILRAAVDQVYRDVQGDGMLFYWPSYGIVMEAFGEGRWLSDRRHLKKRVLAYVMQLFETHYCVGVDPHRSLLMARLRALKATGELPADAVAAVRSPDPDAVKAWVDAHLDADDRETAEFLFACASEVRGTSGVAP